MVGGIIHKAAYEQVQPAIAVIIEPDRAGGPARSSHACLLSHIAECSVTVVLIEDAFSVGGDQHVGPSVVVEIAHRHAHTERAAAHSRLHRYVTERSIAVVLVQRVPNGF